MAIFFAFARQRAASGGQVGSKLVRSWPQVDAKQAEIAPNLRAPSEKNAASTKVSPFSRFLQSTQQNYSFFHVSRANQRGLFSGIPRPNPGPQNP